MPQYLKLLPRWFKLNMLQTALEKGKWKRCKNYLKSLSSADRKISLQNHAVQDIPTLHYLARFSFKKEDEKRINEIIKLFVDSGYNINQTKSSYCLIPRSTKVANKFGRINGICIENCTALIAAVAEQNQVLVKCLIRNGARMDALDSKGRSAFHWAILNGNSNCFRNLIHIGTAADVDETEHIKDLIYSYSLLQKAVESGRKEIVAFLVENQLCDLNKKAIWEMSSESLIALEVVPIQVAILKQQWDIAAYLIRSGGDFSIVTNFPMEHSYFILWNSSMIGTLNSYELLLKMGKIEALPVLDAMLSQGIEETLHCSGVKILCTAVEENQPVFVKKLLNHYAKKVQNGETLSWINTFVSTSPIVQNLSSRVASLERIADNLLSFQGCTLLHFACINECSLDFVQKIVELGADVNLKTTGSAEMTPLHILLIKRQWHHAKYLIKQGVDLQSTVVFNNGSIFQKYHRNILQGGNATFTKIKSCTSVELLLYQITGCKECCKASEILLSLMEQNALSWIGVHELNLAIDIGSPQCVLELLNHCVQTTQTPLNDLLWFTVLVNPSCEIKIPLLHRVFRTTKIHNCAHIHSNLRCLIETLAMAPYNYDFNSVAHGTSERLAVSYFYTPILFHALEIARTNNILTKTLLKYDHLQLNVQNDFGKNPVEYVLQLWSNHGFYITTQYEVNFVVDTVEALISSGTDVTGVSINEKFRYHDGLMPIIKLLYRAGANITQSFFSVRHGFKEPNSDDIQSLKKWKERFDKETKLSLQHCCRLRFRKSLETVGDTRKVKAKISLLPPPLIKYVYECFEL